MTETTRQAGGLDVVLAEHDWRWAIRDSVTGDGVRIACTAPNCEWYAERVRVEDDVWAEQRAHVAAAVLAWVDARLGEAREGVARAILADDIAKGRAAEEWGFGADEEWLLDEADAALTAVREALGLEVEG